jgi:hypothetical protein
VSATVLLLQLLLCHCPYQANYHRDGIYDGKLDWLLLSGWCCNWKSQDFVEVTMGATGGKSVDLIVGAVEQALSATTRMHR